MFQNVVIVHPEVTVVVTETLILVAHHPPSQKWSWADLLKLGTLLKHLSDLFEWLSQFV